MSSVDRMAGGIGNWLDERLHVAPAGKKLLRKVFPEHWSFMLGEIALWSFVVILITGTYLTFFFNPSMQEVVYNGSYVPLQGVRMSQAYASTLDISFEVRGGLIMRQIHHWAALIFLAAIMIHLLRIFFTGAFRKPREINWLIGVTLFVLAILEGFLGYSLSDDLLSGTGVRIAEGVAVGIPLIGTYVSFFAFGGEFPGHDLIPRMFALHILLIPALMVALITVHIGLVFYQKHTQWPGPGKSNRNVIGYPFIPVYMAKAGGFFFMAFGVSAILGGLLQINPIWLYGPYNPTRISAGAQPDFYMGWLEGGLRAMPSWEINAWGHTLTLGVFLPSIVLPGIFFTLLAIYPFIEAWITGDKREHHLLERPRNAPTRTAIGAAGVTFFGLLWLNGGNDVIADKLHLSIYQITWFTRIAIVLGPIIAFVATRLICLGLQRRVARTDDDLFPSSARPHHEPRRTDVDPRAARRANRQVAGMFGLAALLLVGFIASYVGVDKNDMISLPVLGKIGAQNALFGATIGGALVLVGAGLIHWARKTMTGVELVEERHPLRSPEPKRKEGAAAWQQSVADIKLTRRPFLIGGSLLAALGGALTAPLVLLRDLGPLPEKKLRRTAWADEHRIVFENSGEQVKASDMVIGTLVAARPMGVEDPTELAKASIFLIRLEPSEVKSQRELDWGYQGILAFSRICPHVGCPVDLYEHRSHRLLCPCHQSTFDMTDGAKVIFGPAPRPLPQLQITADAAGYLMAKGDFSEPVGPSFWERG